MLEYLRDFLEIVDVSGVNIKIWVMENGVEEELWSGRAMDTPFWIANLKLDYYNAEDGKPILFVDNCISVLVRD